MERRKTLARIVCVVIAATLVAIFAGGQRTSAASTETVTVEIPPTCCGTPGTQSSPQLAFSEDITTQGVLIVEYLVSLAHCSSIRLHVSVDGVEVSTTEFLGYLGDPLGRPMTTGPIDLGPVSSGTHTVTLLPEGTLGGCNGGTSTGSKTTTDALKTEGRQKG